ATVLDDPTITPAGAFGAVRDDLTNLMAEPTDPLADQLSRAAAQLSDRILHQAPGYATLTPQQASRLLTALTGLSGLLAPSAAARPVRCGRPASTRPGCCAATPGSPTGPPRACPSPSGSRRPPRTRFPPRTIRPCTWRRPRWTCTAPACAPRSGRPAGRGWRN